MQYLLTTMKLQERMVLAETEPGSLTAAVAEHLLLASAQRQEAAMTRIREQFLRRTLGISSLYLGHIKPPCFSTRPTLRSACLSLGADLSSLNGIYRREATEISVEGHAVEMLLQTRISRDMRGGFSETRRTIVDSEVCSAVTTRSLVAVFLWLTSTASPILSLGASSRNSRQAWSRAVRPHSIPSR